MNKTKIKIDGDKIYLREVELSDVNQTYVNWLNDPKVNQYLETRYEVQTMDSVRKYVEGMITKEDELFFQVGDMKIVVYLMMIVKEAVFQTP